MHTSVGPPDYAHEVDNFLASKSEDVLRNILISIYCINADYYTRQQAHVNIITIEEF